MTLRNSQECACRVLDEHRTNISRKRRPFVILAPKQDLPDVRNMISASMPAGSQCFGANWLSPDGEVIAIRGFDEDIPTYKDGFDLEVCNGGRDYSPDERRHVERWRKASED
jgi:hypothetical protein